VSRFLYQGLAECPLPVTDTPFDASLVPRFRPQDWLPPLPPPVEQGRWGFASEAVFAAAATVPDIPQYRQDETQLVRTPHLEPGFSVLVPQSFAATAAPDLRDRGNDVTPVIFPPPHLERGWFCQAFTSAMEVHFTASWASWNRPQQFPVFESPSLTPSHQSAGPTPSVFHVNPLAPQIPSQIAQEPQGREFLLPASRTPHDPETPWIAVQEPYRASPPVEEGWSIGRAPFTDVEDIHLHWPPAPIQQPLNQPDPARQDIYVRAQDLTVLVPPLEGFAQPQSQPQFPVEPLRHGGCQPPLSWFFTLPIQVHSGYPALFAHHPQADVTRLLQFIYQVQVVTATGIANATVTEVESLDRRPSVDPEDTYRLRPDPDDEREE
jgi:hypothetical protein